MLIRTKELKGFKLLAKDGSIGKVDEFYFDDKHWTIRYLVANTGSWLSDRKVLISPYGLESIDREIQSISVDLTKKQIENSPAIGTNKPVSLQFEKSYYNYFGWPMYWNGYYPWGESSLAINRQMNDTAPSAKKPFKKWDHHLRSTHAVSGYHVHACDGDAGRITDFVLDDETWAIRYLIVETGHWLSSRKVLISPLWVENVSWNKSKVFTSLSMEEIRTSPEYTDEALLDRTYEKALHIHYGRDAYWDMDLPHFSSEMNFRKDPSRELSERRFF
jgi:uncharacterized protein YrrD